MLWKRVITAVVLALLLLGALFALPPTGIAILIGVVVTIATWELTLLLELKSLSSRIIYTLLVVGLGIVGSIWILKEGSLFPVFAIAVSWWIYAFYYVVSAANENQKSGSVFDHMGSRMVIGLLIMVPTWLAFLMLYITDPAAPNLLLYALLLVWVADTFAYFSGKAWGRTKLAPSISPGKSVEGVVGGLIGVAILATVAGHYFWQYDGQHLIVLIVLSLVVGAISIVGDLIESVFKRRVGVKDSGTLLPGHGGLFDRIDALTAAIPVFAFGWQITNGASW